MKNLLNVFLEPRAVFEELIKSRKWQNALLPMALTAVLGLLSMLVLRDLLTEYQIRETTRIIMDNTRIPDDQKEAIIDERLQSLEHPSKGMIIFGYLSSALATPLRIGLMAAIILFIGNFFFGGRSSYTYCLVMTAYTYMIAVLETMIKVPLMISQWKMEIFTGLGLLGLGEKGSFLYHFLNGLDLFSFWRVLVLAIGMSVIYQRNTKPFAIALTIYWILQTTFFAFLGSLFT